MSSNIPVANLAAALSLDVSGFASGVQQAEMLARRLAKSQEQAMELLRSTATTGRTNLDFADQSIGTPFSLQGAGSNVIQQTKEWTRSIEEAGRAAQRARTIAEGLFLSVSRGPVIGLPTAETSAFNADSEALAEQMAAGREAAVRRRVEMEQAAGRALLAGEQQRAREKQRLIDETSAKEAAAHRQQMEHAAELASLRSRTLQAREQSRMENASPFRQQVMATQKLNELLQARKAIQQSSLPAQEKELALARQTLAVQQQIREVRAIRSSLTAGRNLGLLGSTAADSQKGISRFSLAIQQTGYQVQDFAVQVASGTNALVALSQQGSQLLGFFGGFKGALAGAALSVGILAYRLYSAEEQAKKAAKALKEMGEAWKGVRDQQVSQVLARGDTSPLRILEITEREMKLAEERKNKVQDQIQFLQSQLNEAPRVKMFAFWGLVPAGENALLFSSEDQKAAYEKRVKEFEAKMQKAGKFGDDVIRAQKLETATLLGAEILGGAQLGERVASLAEEEMKKLPDLIKEYDKWKEALRKITEEKRAVARATAAQQRQKELSNKRTDLEQRRSEMDFNRLSNVQKFLTLQKNLANIVPKNEEEKLRIQELMMDMEEYGEAAKQEAEAYLDQLEPLRAKRRELEKIRELQGAGFFGDRDVAAQFAGKLRDEMERSLRLPDAFSFKGGGQSTGGFVGTSTAQVQLDLQRKALEALTRITNYTAMMAGAN